MTTIYVVEIDNGDHDMYFGGAFTTPEAAIESVAHMTDLRREETHIYEWELDKPVDQRSRLDYPDIRDGKPIEGKRYIPGEGWRDD